MAPEAVNAATTAAVAAPRVVLSWVLRTVWVFTIVVLGR
jgi:hypothetical protein